MMWVWDISGDFLLILPVKVDPFDFKRLSGIPDKFLRHGDLEISFFQWNLFLPLARNDLDLHPQWMSGQKRRFGTRRKKSLVIKGHCIAACDRSRNLLL